MFEQIKQERHPLYRNISLALTHQANENYSMALIYWGHATRLAPPDFPLKLQIVREFNQVIQDLLSHQKVQEAETVRNQLAKFEPNFEAMLQERPEITLQQSIYLGIVHQCRGNYPLSFAYWKQAVAQVPFESGNTDSNDQSKHRTSHSFFIPSSTLDLILKGMEDYCWIAREHWKKGEVRKTKEIYRNLLELNPQFLEVYVNLSLIYYNSGEIENAMSLLERSEMECKENLLVYSYFNLYKMIEELKSQFDEVPYAAVEKLVEQSRMESIFYPFVEETYLSFLVDNLIAREKKSLEKKRLETQEKAISGTSKALAREGISLGERIAMARNAGKGEIYRFLHDNDPKIIEVLLNNPHLDEEDVSIIAQTNKVSEILELVASHFRWATRHRILLAIVCNPQIDPARSKKLLSSLRLKDLAIVYHNKRVSAEVRLEARKLAQEIFRNLPLSDQVAVVEASSGDILRILDRLPPKSLKFLDLVLERFFRNIEIILNLSRWWETPAEILEKVGQSPQWQRNPQVRFALLTNPRTSPHLVTKLLQDLQPDELRWMAENKAIPPYVKGVIEKMSQGLPDNHLYFQ
jgi:tetratricopeptide (TPR) repeat protein